MAGRNSQPGKSVAAKISDVLAAFETHARPLSLTEIAEETGLPRSSVHRMLAELVDLEILARTADQRFQPSLRLWRLAQTVGKLLRETAMPHVQDLYSLTGETSQLAVRDGGEALYIFRFFGTKRRPRASYTGGRLPLHTTAVGKVLLAYDEDWVADTYLRATLTDPRQRTRLAEELEEVKSKGFATTYQEQRMGTCSIAVPVWHTNTIGASLGLVLSSDKFELLPRYLPTLRAISTRITEVTSHIPLETLLQSSKSPA